MTMGLSTLLHLLVLTLIVVLPGRMLHRAWLHRFGLSWRVGAGLVLALMSILSGNLSALIGYSLPLMLIIIAMVVGGITLWWWREDTDRSQLFSLPKDQAWTLFQLVLMGVFIAPAFILYLSLDTDAQGFGYLALMVREGGTIHTLAPFQNDVRYLYSPGLFVWWAFFSDLFSIPLHQVMLPFTHIMAGIVALLSIDLAEALAPERPRLRWLMPITLVGGMGLFLTMMDSAYTTVIGFVFVTLFLTLLFHGLHTKSRPVMLLSALPLAAVTLTHPDTIIILLIGYIPFYATFWFSSQEKDRQNWQWMFIIVPAIGVSLTGLWLFRVYPLFFEELVVSPFILRLKHIRQLTLYHGVLIPILALFGAVASLRRRSLADLLMLTWFIAILDFSMFGITDKLISLTGFDIMRYVYPFSVAWHGPFLVYAYFSARLIDTLLDWRPINLSSRTIKRLLTAGLVGMLALILFQNPILAFSQGKAAFFGAFSSRADISAMDYLRNETPEDSLILNYPYGHEAHWLPVIAERESVTFRDQPFFANAEPYYQRAEDLAEIYFDLASPGAEVQLREYGITHIVIPQIVTSPETFGDMQSMMRWNFPDEARHEFISHPDDIDWLELVFKQDGARVYRLIPEGE